MHFVLGAFSEAENRSRMTNTNDDARENTPGIIKIIGIGQSIRGDDAAGLAAVRLWQDTFIGHSNQANIQVELAEVPGIGLLTLLEGADVAILVDAVQSGAQPGTIHLVSEDQLDAFSSSSASAHGWGVAETLALGHQLTPENMPGKIYLIGIEAVDFAFGGPFTLPVEQALPQAARLIERLVTQQ